MNEEKKPARRCLVFGEFDSDNVGDQLIGRGAERLLGNSCLCVEVLPLGRVNRKRGVAKSGPKKLPLFKRLHRWRYANSYFYRHLIECVQLPLRWPSIKKQAQAYVASADIIVLGGGQLFHDNSLRMLIRILALLQATKEQRKPFVVFGAGVSHPKTIVSYLLLRRVLGQLGVNQTWFRDFGSVAKAASLAARPRSDFATVPDLAIAAILPENRLPPLARVEVCGIAPMAVSSLPVTQKAHTHNSNLWWAILVEELCQQGVTPVLFCSGVLADYARCKEVRALLLERGLEVGILPRPLNGEQFVSQLMGFHRVVGQRLHISISYYSIGGAPLSLPWDDKVSSFYESIGLGAGLVRLDSRPSTVCRMVMNIVPPKIMPIDNYRQLVKTAESLFEHL